LEEHGRFNVPPTDIHFLYDVFGSSELDMRISNEQFNTTLAGPKPQEEEGHTMKDAPGEEESLRIKKDPKTPSK